MSDTADPAPDPHLLLQRLADLDAVRTLAALVHARDTAGVQAFVTDLVPRGPVRAVSILASALMAVTATERDPARPGAPERKIKRGQGRAGSRARSARARA